MHSHSSSDLALIKLIQEKLIFMTKHLHLKDFIMSNCSFIQKELLIHFESYSYTVRGTK